MAVSGADMTVDLTRLRVRTRLLGFKDQRDETRDARNRNDIEVAGWND
ncbi:MAG: hypothetical protein OXI44_04185 [Bacteroidota bacterium]|nr:hypothetical protein [Bacteroidota bacterium]